MFRIVPVLVLVLGMAAGVFGADPPGIKLGEKFEGEISKVVNAKGKFNAPALESLGLPRGPGRAISDFVTGGCYGAEVPVTLKAGQSLSVTVTLKGDGRKAILVLQDKTGKAVAYSKEPEVATLQLKVEEVNASGKFKIVVVSDQVGAFTLRATGPAGDPADEETDEKALETKIGRLKKELAEAEAKLKALKAKR